MRDKAPDLLAILGQLLGPRGVEAMKQGAKVLDAAANFAQVFVVPAAKPAEDPYRILGVEATDPWELVQRVYRAKARVLHPDTKATGNEEAYKRLQWAYDQVKERRTAP